MKKFYLLIILIITILIAAGIYYSNNQNQKNRQTENSATVVAEITREELMQDLNGRIGEISPASPILGRNWQINRFWFPQQISESCYLEYEDGYNLRQILVEAERKNNKLDYKIVAYFEAGENDWILKSGEDKFKGESLDLYEHNEELGQWIRKN